MQRFHFPRWTNTLVRGLPIVVAITGVYLVGLLAFGASPATLAVGYAPEQPIPFSHKLHAGELAIDCRYCHTTVEEAAHAAIPPAATCMNCHERIKTDSPLLLPLREAVATDRPIEWKRVHDLADYAYFDHSAHVTRGVSCVSCHGRVDQMEVVRQVEPLSMGWCLDCHRDPAPNVRPVEHVFDLAWEPQGDARTLGERLIEERGIAPSTDCSTCHR